MAMNVFRVEERSVDFRPEVLYDLAIFLSKYHKSLSNVLITSLGVVYRGLTLT